jgi:hypothetical protein
VNDRGRISHADATNLRRVLRKELNYCHALVTSTDQPHSAIRVDHFDRIGHHRPFASWHANCAADGRRRITEAHARD